MKKLIAVFLLFSMLVTAAFGAGGEGGYATVYAAENYIPSYNVGDIVSFGVYEQDNRIGNGPESIEWVILENDAENYLLISRYGLDARSFHRVGEQVTWETSSMRAWLNNDFFNSAFTAEERDSIIPTNVSNKDNPEFGVDGGGDTSDQVFLLSHEEVLKYFPQKNSRIIAATKYAQARGAREDDKINCYWWLRTPGKIVSQVECIFPSGTLYSNGSDAGNASICIRPVIKIKQDALEPREMLVLDKHEMIIADSDAVELTATISPQNPQNRPQWNSSDPLVASVDEKGEVTVKGLGETIITVAMGGLSESCRINVIPGFSFSMMGAAISTNNPMQMRFGMKFDKDAVYERYFGSIVSVGMLIIPSDLIGEGELTLETPDALNISSSVFIEDADSIIYSVQLNGIPGSEMNRELICRGYVSYSDASGGVHAQYGDCITRSYQQVAENVRKEYAEGAQDDISHQLFLDKLEKLMREINSAVSFE